MKGILIVLALSVGALLAGGQGLYTALKNQKQLVMSCDEYIKAKPQDAWVKLTDCEYSIVTALINEKRRRLDEVLIPVWGVNQKEEELASIVLTSSDLQLVKKFKAFADAETKEEAEKLIKENEKDYSYRGTIEGIAEFGFLDRSSKNKDEVVSISEAVAKDAVFIRKDEKPEYGYNLFLIVIGLALPTGYFFIRARRKKQSPPAPIEPTRSYDIPAEDQSKNSEPSS